MDLELNQSQATVLAEVLESYLGDLSTEIAHTDSYEYRQGLKERRETLAGILESLQREVTSPS